MGPLGLTFSAVSAMIGSGWLFSSMMLTKSVGPMAILAWVFGAILVMMIAFTYAELSAMLPVTGGSARLPRLTHGTFVSLTFAWITWINLMTTAPIEVQAMLQYTSTYWPSLVHQHSHGLTKEGLGLATLLMIFFCFLNAYSIRLVNRFNSILTVWKIGIALITAAVLIIYMFHAHQTSNFHNPALGGFNPFGWNSVFVAISTGGVLFAFNGYKQVVELAGETENPRKNVIRALIGSLTIVALIYVLLQVGFIGALPKASPAMQAPSLDY
jgi:amino acid transporter